MAREKWGRKKALQAEWERRHKLNPAPTTRIWVESGFIKLGNFTISYFKLPRIGGLFSPRFMGDNAMRNLGLIFLFLSLTGCAMPTQSLFTPVGNSSDGIDIGKLTDSRISDMTLATRALGPSVLSGTTCESSPEKAGFSVSVLNKNASQAVGALASDAVVKEVMKAAIRTVARTRFNADISACAGAAPSTLTYQDFVNFTNTVGSIQLSTSTTGMQAGEFLKTIAPPLSSYLLVYLNNYFQGKFVDRFENQIPKPTFAKGVDDTTISNFARILLEAVSDCSLNAVGGVQIYVDNVASPTKYYPAETATAPTATLIYSGSSASPPIIRFVALKQITTPPSESSPGSGNGVTENEAKFTQFAANQAASEAVVLSSGFLKTLKNIHAGIIISGTFSIGDNDTVVEVATAAIEVISRRSVEAASYEIFEQIDGDKLPLIKLISVLGK